MLFSTSTNPYSGFGNISSIFFNDIAPFIYFIFGIVIAFYIIEYIIDLFAPIDIISKKRDRKQKLQDLEDYESVKDLLNDE